MLSKLIKHEFRATSRIMWPVFLGMLALTALMRFSQLLLNGEHIPWLLQLIGVLLVIGFVMGLGALGLAPLVLSAVRWRDHVLKDEGYLTLTLPVSVHELLASKLIVSAVWYAAAFLVGVLSLLIAASDWASIAMCRKTSSISSRHFLRWTPHCAAMRCSFCLSCSATSL